MKKRALVLGSYLCLLLLVGCGAPKVVHTSSEVDIAYALTFLDGSSLSAGETTLIIGETSDFSFFDSILLGSQAGDVFSGTLSAQDTYARLYDPALQQKLSEVYFSAMDIVPAVGESVVFSSLGTGVIVAQEQEEGILKYTIDFNAPETYLPLQYEIQVLSVKK